MRGEWFEAFDLEPQQGHYELLRGALSERYAHASSAAVERVARKTFGVHAAGELEDWLSTMAQIGQAVLPVLAGAAGTMIGGPVGAAAGTALGTAGAGAIGAAAASRDKDKNRRSARKQLKAKGQAKARVSRSASPSPSPAPTPPSPPAAPAAASANPQAATLLALLSRPEVMQALAAMAFGQAGASHVDVGDTPVPVEAIAGLVGMLADQAAVQHAASSQPAVQGGIPGYLLDEESHPRCVVSSPEGRGQVLLELFAEAIASEAGEDEFDDDIYAEYAPYEPWMFAPNPYEVDP